MGPYCRFCNRRCFVPMPEYVPQTARRAYGSATIIATCPEGQRFEAMATGGWCYDTIVHSPKPDAHTFPPCVFCQSAGEIFYRGTHFCRRHVLSVLGALRPTAKPQALEVGGPQETIPSGPPDELDRQLWRYIGESGREAS